jgi:hypothetical protein
MKRIFLDTFLCVTSERVFILVRVTCHTLFPVVYLIVQCACLEFCFRLGSAATGRYDEHTIFVDNATMVGW